MARISIIVSAVGSQTDIDETLVSVLEHRTEDCEVILAHPTAYVDPYDLGDEIRFASSDETDPLSLFNAGLSLARGELIHTISPGLLATEGWCDAARKRFELNTNIGSVSPLVVSPSQRQPIRGVAFHNRRGKCLIRSTNQPVLSPLLGTGFYRAAALRFMHGFDNRFGEYADVELGFRLREAGYEVLTCKDSQVGINTTLPGCVVTGFRGGKLRARLSMKAYEHGAITRRHGWWGLLGEPLNRLGPTAISAMLGHLVVWMTPTAKPAYRLMNSSVEGENSTRKLRKAA